MNIQVLSIFYLGKQDNIKLSWSDIPETWSDRHDAANCILIEMKNLDETLKYNLTFFVTTGTIRAFAIDELQAFTAFSILDESINVTFSSFFIAPKKQFSNVVI
jgi:hypothetical protein